MNYIKIKKYRDNNSLKSIYFIDSKNRKQGKCIEYWNSLQPRISTIHNYKNNIRHGQVKEYTTKAYIYKNYFNRNGMFFGEHIRYTYGKVYIGWTPNLD